MHLGKYWIILILLLFTASATYSQESYTEICVDFRVNSSIIDSSYLDNAVRVQEIIEFLQNIRKDSTINIIGVSFCGSTSPEGSNQVNQRLARGRLTSLEKLVRKEVDIPDSLITYNESYIPWDYLKAQIKDSELPRKEEVMAILDEEGILVDYLHPNTHIDNRIVKLKALENGRIWQQMNRQFFSRMRNACAVFVTYKKELPPVQEPVIVPDTVVTVSEPVKEVVEIVPDTTIVETAIQVEEWMRRLYVKSNAVGWGMLIGNVAVEMDFAKHWSFALPVYYSALNYFTSDIKFRTLCFQPEVRYWLDENNEGWFGGAHLGLAYFNYAKGGDWRYQDHDGKTPIWGGGISAGYRMPISKNNRWHMEFSLGTGVYKLHYDIFHNEHNGQHVDTRKRVFFGIDQASVSFSYSFDLKKKGDKR